MPMAEEERLLTTGEALALLGVARSTLHRMIDRGELHPVRVRAVVRKQPLYFRESEIRAILAQRPATES